MKLRDYQLKAIRMLREALAAGFRKIILKLATGAGKTVIVSQICRQAVEKGKRVCFVVDQITLVDQASATLDKMGIDHGVIQAQHPRHDLSLPVQVASIQTYVRRLAWEADLFIVDEAHVVYKGLLEMMDKFQVPFIGVTATPYTKGLGLHYETLVSPIEIGELIELGHLVDARVFGPSKPDMRGVTMVGDDYNQKQGAKKANTKKLVADIVNTWLRLANRRPTICFAWDIVHSKHIVERFVDAGVNAVHIDCYMDDDEVREIIDRFKRGEIEVLSSVGKLIKGFDAPNAEVGILARSTKSLALHHQMVGRILRPCEGKREALILDHAGNFERLGFHTDEVPNVLCKKQKGERQEKRKVSLPKPCPKCAFMRPPKVNICPECGYEAKKQNKVHESSGDLKEIKKPKVDKSEKQRWFSCLLEYARARNYNDGWVAHKYREKFGVWPRGMVKVRTKIDPDVMDFIVSANIRYRNSYRGVHRDT